MPNFTALSNLRMSMLFVAATMASGTIWPIAVTAQDFEQNLHSQLVELQQKVAQLEAALNQKSAGMRAASSRPAEQATMQNMQGMSATASQDQSAPNIKPAFQNCVQCHQTRPPGPLPVSHVFDFRQAASGSQMSQSSTGGTANQQPAMGSDAGGGMKGGKGMGMMGGMSGGSGGMGMMDKGMGMMGGKMGGMSGDSGGMGMGGMSGGSSGMGGMSGGGSAGASNQGMESMGNANNAGGGADSGSIGQQMNQMQQQMQQMMQMQMMQMKVMEMQMKMMEMKQ